VGLLLIGLVLAIGCGGSGESSHNPGSEANGNSEEEQAINVRVAPVALASIPALYSTSATLRADRRATVIARTRGVIQRLEVEEGDTVVEEQPLAILEDDEQRIAAARNRTSRDAAGREMERLRGLFEEGLVSQDEFEKSRRDAEDAEHALDLAELELSRTVIRAPFSGAVLERHLDVGATVADGTAVYALADLDPLYADVNIPERHVIRLRPGQEVRLTADSTGTTVGARIERIAPQVDPTTGTVKVTVAVAGSPGLRPGAFVRVDIVTDTHEDALVVERPALVAEGRRWNLYRLQDDGETVEQIEVRLGFENGHRVEVAGLVDESKTLAPGNQVVVVGASALSDGARVRVVEEDGVQASQQDSDETGAGDDG
jgi:RND family efflux transporter MFP subunit